ncbi:MAG: hypothetical protein P8P49_03655 [Opitutales bacterium]|nr:hypothetical protein [Opitutales bacterium]
MNIAVLDIGSNTTKILIAAKSNTGKLVSVAEKSYPCRLGTSLMQERPVLSVIMRDTTIKVIDQLLSFATPFSPVKTRIVATEALRRIENADLLIKEVQNLFSLNIEILSGAEEAFFIASGLLTDPALNHVSTFCAIDLGGGSMEIMRICNGTCESVKSLPLGAVVLAEQFLGNLANKPGQEGIVRLQNHVFSTLADSCVVLLKDCSHLVGSGGSIVFLRHLISSMNQLDFEQQSKLNEDSIKVISNKMNGLDLASRCQQFPLLPADRADVFPAALLAIMELLKFCQLTSITHSFHNLRYGIAENIINSFSPLK